MYAYVFLFSALTYLFFSCIVFAPTLTLYVHTYCLYFVRSFGDSIVPMTSNKHFMPHSESSLIIFNVQNGSQDFIQRMWQETQQALSNSNQNRLSFSLVHLHNAPRTSVHITVAKIWSKRLTDQSNAFYIFSVVSLVYPTSCQVVSLGRFSLRSRHQRAFV